MKIANLLTAVLAVALAPALSLAAEKMGKAGTRINGYTFSSDVSHLTALSSTFCQIWGSVLSGNSSKGLSLYYTPGGFADLVASKKGQGKPYYNMLFSGIAWKEPSDINTFINTSVSTFLSTGDPAALAIGMVYSSRGKIMLDYLDSAIDHRYSGVKAKTHVLKALDGAFAMLSGNHEFCQPGNAASSMAMVSENESPHNSFIYHDLPFNQLMYARLFGDAQAAAGNATIVKQMVKQIVQLYAEYPLIYSRMNAYEADVGYGCELPAVVNSITKRTLAMWPTGKALLKGLNATAGSLDAMETLLNTGAGPGFLNVRDPSLKGVVSEVTDAIKNVISTTNIQLRNLGMPTIELKATVVMGGNCSYIPPTECPKQPEGICPSS